MAAVIIVVLLVSLHLFTSNGFESPGQLGKLISRNRREEPQSQTEAKKSQEVEDQFSKKLETLRTEFDEKLKAVQSSQKLPCEDKTTETPEPQKQPQTLTLEDQFSKKLETLRTEFDEKLKAVQSSQKLPGEDKTTETPEPQKQPQTLTPKKQGNGTNSDTENLLTKVEDQLSKKLETLRTEFDEKLKAVQSSQKLPGEDKTAEIPEPQKQPQTVPQAEIKGSDETHQNVTTVTQIPPRSEGTVKLVIYVLIVLVLLMAGYVIYVKRQTIKAYILPEKNKDKNKSTINYERLKKDDEVTLLEKKIKNKASSYAY